MFEKYEAYQLSLKRQRDWNSIINTAREEGREEGRKRQKMHIAQLMKQDGEPISKIIRFTGLAEQEISEL
ncbi:MAG: hypothetical protein LIP03_02145 [Bacteroidales bacterium]|nr:hypothetical protein [Bacteroidales bacterium]